MYDDNADDGYEDTRSPYELKQKIESLYRLLAKREEEIDRLEKENVDLLSKWVSAVEHSNVRMVTALLNGAKPKQFIGAVTVTAGEKT